MDQREFFDTVIKQEPLTKQRLFLGAVFLFSSKGFSNVGIREICRMINIKESSFYNHYDSKDALLQSIFDRFTVINKQAVFTQAEIDAIAEQGDAEIFFQENMRKFSSLTSDPIYYAMLRIVHMECYTDPRAYAISKRHIYEIRKDCTETVLSRLIEKGAIKKVDVSLFTAEYYYTLKALLDEYLLAVVWEEDKSAIMEKIGSHIKFFADILTKK